VASKPRKKEKEKAGAEAPASFPWEDK